MLPPTGNNRSVGRSTYVEPNLGEEELWRPEDVPERSIGQSGSLRDDAVGKVTVLDGLHGPQAAGVGQGLVLLLGRLQGREDKW